MQTACRATLKNAPFSISPVPSSTRPTGHDWKFEIKAVYGVFLMNFIMDKNIKLRTDVILADKETGELFSEKFRQIFIALPLFKKSEEECETNFERWIYILNNMET